MKNKLVTYVETHIYIYNIYNTIYIILQYIVNFTKKIINLSLWCQVLLIILFIIEWWLDRPTERENYLGAPWIYFDVAENLENWGSVLINFINQKNKKSIRFNRSQKFSVEILLYSIRPIYWIHLRFTQ